MNAPGCLALCVCACELVEAGRVMGAHRLQARDLCWHFVGSPDVVTGSRNLPDDILAKPSRRTLKRMPAEVVCTVVARHSGPDCS